MSDRGSRAWKEGKNRKTKRLRPELNQQQLIQFFELVAQMTSNTVFERKLGLSPGDIAFYKKVFDIESQDEARKLANRLKSNYNSEHETKLIERTKEARKAEETAQARLEEIQTQREQNVIERTPVDVNQIRQEDAERQRRFAKQQAEVDVPNKVWTLPIESGQGTEQEQIDRFRRQIVNHGLNFASKMYHATPEQIKYEANRLKLKINWDTVRR